MTFDEARAIKCKAQLPNGLQPDYVLVMGAGLCGYAGLPLTVSNCVLLGTCVVNRLPATMEEAIAASAVYFPDMPDQRLKNILTK